MVRKPPALAKITPPRLHDVLARTRLFDALDTALKRPVVWLCAQPGAGKTTLAASYLQARKRHGLWYQVDDGDADVASCIYHLRLAARALDEDAGAALPLLTPEYLADLRGFARRFFRALYATLAPGSVLTFDNFQEVPADAPLHRVLAEAIAQLPRECALLVISRTEPPPAYAPLLASDAIAVLDAEALRLTLAETEAIAGQRGIDDAAAIEALHARSHGWAAGLTLLLARSRGRDDALADDSESLQHVFGYFAQRVFDDLGPEAQRVLMQLAFLPQMAPALAERLTGSADAPRLLEQFYKRHLFTDRRRIAGGPVHHVFQFHALFRTFLRHQAAASFSDNERRQIAQRAGRLLADDGLPEQALECLAEAQDWPSYADTVLAHAEVLIEQGRGQTVLDWLARLPDVERDARPWLGYWSGRAQMATAPDRAVPLLQAVHARFAAAGDAPGQLASGAAIIQTLWYARLGWSEITPWVDRLEPLMGGAGPWPVADGGLRFPSRGVELLSMAALHASLAFCRLAHPGLSEMARLLLALIDDPTIDWNHRLAAATHLMTWFHNAAEHALATQLIGRVDPVVEQRPSSALNRAFWFTFRAIHDMRLGRYEQASALFQRAEDLAREQGLARAEYAAVQFRSYLDIMFRRADDAAARIARLEVHPARVNLDAQLNLSVLHTMLAQLRNRPEVALAHAQQALQTVQRIGAAFFHAMFPPAVASAFADAGQPEQALRVIAGARDVVRGSYMEALHAQLLLEDAYVALTRGDADGARMRTHEGLALAAREPTRAAYVHRIVARKPELLVLALREGIEPALVRELIRRWRVPPPADALAAWPYAVSVRTLGGFEVRVHDEPLAFGRKAPKKTLALLKALIARGGAAPDSALIDLFWPDEPGDAASKSLAAAVHRLRQLLTVPDAVVQQGGQVSLDPQHVWVDAWSFERGLASGDARMVVEALELYRGAFLAEEEGESWPVALRERLRGKFVHAVAEHAARLEAAQCHDEAIGWYLRGIDADPVVELFYQGLMRCYQRLDRLPEAVSVYRRLKQVLSVTLSLPPSEGTERLYRSLRST
jgi:LuxR family transcriptional regulator, maltose regulon positive regulatory protein